MDILLLVDIEGIGRQYTIQSVSDGLALNEILPQRLALVATPTVRRKYGARIKAAQGFIPQPTDEA